MDSEKLNIFLNKNLKKSCSICYRPKMTLNEIISESSEILGLKAKRNYKVFDSAGGELSDGDVELLNPQEPLFLSQGEEFVKECALSIYTEVRILGKGGFGTVKLYINKITKEEVALKFVDYRSLLNTEDVLRMYNEIALLRNLRHTSIVKLIDAFDLEDKMCFVMEYCSGGELMDYIKLKGPLPEHEIYSLGAQIVDAVRYCHNSQVIHRDLKPQNVLFSNESRTIVKIVDFGISGMFSVGRIGESSEAGSLLYTAPEVISGRDYRAAPALDVWSLGCILFEMLTSKHPFLDEDADSTINRILRGAYEAVPSNLPVHWKRFFKKIFQISPENRWTMLEISSYFDKLRFGGDSSSSKGSFEEEEEVKAKSFKSPQELAKNRNIEHKPTVPKSNPKSQ